MLGLERGERPQTLSARSRSRRSRWWRAADVATAGLTIGIPQTDWMNVTAPSRSG